jgi:hypothetical protein
MGGNAYPVFVYGITVSGKEKYIEPLHVHKRNNKKQKNIDNKKRFKFRIATSSTFGDTMIFYNIKINNAANFKDKFLYYENSIEILKMNEFAKKLNHKARWFFALVGANKNCEHSCDDNYYYYFNFNLYYKHKEIKEKKLLLNKKKNENDGHRSVAENIVENNENKDENEDENENENENEDEYIVKNRVEDGDEYDYHCDYDGTKYDYYTSSENENENEDEDEDENKNKDEDENENED